jgi:hypothetical protein
MNIPQTQFSRRAFLRGSGALVALPFLESMAKPLSVIAADGKSVQPMRMVCIGLNYGMHPQGFFPQETGHSYSLPYLLEPLDGLQNDFTVFSHLDHPGMKGGHEATHTFLSGIRADMAKSMPEGNITMDQKAAEFVGSATRYQSMQLNVGGGDNGLSWTRNGISIPALSNLQQMFDALFLETDQAHKRRLARSYKLNSSILDVVRDDAQDLQKRLSANDLEKLDEYFTSVREVEKRLQMSEAWLNKPKPKVDYRFPRPIPTDFYEEVPLYYDLMKLALMTDSTRVLTYSINGWSGDSGLPGVTQGYHALTHHGMDPSRLKELTIIETFHARQFARLIEDLKRTEVENQTSLLDKTMVLFGSGMGNASSHSNRDLPLILAGGGFTHGEHKDYPKIGDKQTPACNLYVSMLQKFGLEIDDFGTSTGTLDGLS